MEIGIERKRKFFRFLFFLELIECNDLLNDCMEVGRGLGCFEREREGN